MGNKNLKHFLKGYKVFQNPNKQNPLYIKYTN